MYGQVGSLQSLGTGFLYDIPFNDKNGRSGRYINHPDQCIERCRTLDTAAYAIVKSEAGEPSCGCGTSQLSFTPAKGYDGSNGPTNLYHVSFFYYMQLHKSKSIYFFKSDFRALSCPSLNILQDTIL